MTDTAPKFVDEDETDAREPRPDEPPASETHFHDYIDFQTWKRTWPKPYIKSIQQHGPEFERLVGVLNPTSAPITFDIRIGSPPFGKAARRGFDPRSLRCRCVIPPQATVAIPRAWARAVHVVRGGVIVGGLAPQARLVDLETGIDISRPAHPSLLETDARAIPKGRRR